jgi:hypothetical protein
LRLTNLSKEPRPQGGALKPKIQNQTEIPNQVRDDKNREPNPVVMLNPGLTPGQACFKHLVCFFLLPADALFIAVHRAGLSDAILKIRRKNYCSIHFIGGCCHKKGGENKWER